MPHRRLLSEKELSEVVARVAAQEAAGEIEPWRQQDTPACLLPELPTPGSIVSRRALPALGATELTLSNGMRVCPLQIPSSAEFEATPLAGEEPTFVLCYDSDICGGNL